MSVNPISSPAMRRLCPWAVAVAAALGLLASPAPAQTACAVDCQSSVCDICVDGDSTQEIDSSVSTNCIDVAAGSTLNIAEGATLTVTDGAGNKKSCVNGNVNLLHDPQGGVSTLAFANNNHKVVGSGAINGQDNDARIIISTGVTLKCGVDITGRLQIIGAGNFVNGGRVIADSFGTLDVDVSGTVRDTSGATRWEVSDFSTAQLRFLRGDYTLVGAFTVSNGTLRAGSDPAVGDDIDVCTTGNLTQTGGEIIAGQDDSFKFSAQTCP